MTFFGKALRALAVVLAIGAGSLHAKPAKADGGAVVAGIAGGLLLGTLIGSTSHANTYKYHAPATTYYAPPRPHYYGPNVTFSFGKTYHAPKRHYYSSRKHYRPYRGHGYRHYRPYRGYGHHRRHYRRYHH